MHRQEAKASPRHYRFFGLPDFAVGVIRELPVNESAPRIVVFCGRGKIEAVLDEAGDRRERLEMSLPESHAFETLGTCERARTPFDQRAFLRLLRIDLAGCCPEGLVGTFQSLKFTRASDGEQEISVARESMGKSIKMQLAAGKGNNIPEEVTLRVNVYRDLTESQDPALRKDVRCAIDTNLDEATFTLIPLGGELETAQRETDDWVHRFLKTEFGPAVDVLCGCPVAR